MLAIQLEDIAWLTDRAFLARLRDQGEARLEALLAEVAAERPSPQLAELVEILRLVAAIRRQLDGLTRRRGRRRRAPTAESAPTAPPGSSPAVAELDEPIVVPSEDPDSEHLSEADLRDVHPAVRTGSPCSAGQ